MAATVAMQRAANRESAAAKAAHLQRETRELECVRGQRYQMLRGVAKIILGKYLHDHGHHDHHHSPGAECPRPANSYHFGPIFNESQPGASLLEWRNRRDANKLQLVIGQKSAIGTETSNPNEVTAILHDAGRLLIREASRKSSSSSSSSSLSKDNHYVELSKEIRRSTSIGGNQCVDNEIGVQHISLEQRQPGQRAKPQQRLVDLIISFLIVASCLHNASPCSGFSDPDNYYNTGFAGHYNHNHQTHLITPPEPANSDWRLSKRSADTPPQRTTTTTRRLENDDMLTGMMSAVFSSFLQDQSSSSTLPPQGAAQSWISIFGGGGGGGSNNNGASNNAGGGGGDALDIHIKNILVPRVSGTPGNAKVRQYIVDALKRNAYHVELDEFIGSTPVGNVKFSNIIASSDPGACRQLVLACHYDSKMMNGFLGATDSAGPCAMLLKISETFSKSYRPNSVSPSGGTSDRDDDDNKDSLGLRFIFFDGEEAFVHWSSTDSLYGSRHLAAKWAQQPAPGQCKSSKTELDRIELFVLLDLIGTGDTSFVKYNTQSLGFHYDALQRYEKAHLLKSGLNQVQARRQAAFKGRSMPLDFVEDDHVPFKKRGVPILLLLAHPFPRVWHTIGDNYAAIDFPKTRRILRVMEEFVASYPNKHEQQQ